MTTLDVSNNPELYWLFCSSNQLSSLDVSNNTSLADLRCNNNQLVNLDLSYNPELLIFNGNDNDLSSLNLKGRHPSEYEVIEVIENYDLECVDVLDPDWALDNWEEYFERDVEFEFICGAGERSQWHVSADGSNNSGDGSFENPLENVSYTHLTLPTIYSV